MEIDNFLFMVTGEFGIFDDVVDGQPIDHNFITTSANSVLSFSTAGLACLFDNVAAAFSLATVSVESTIVLYLHMR